MTETCLVIFSVLRIWFHVNFTGGSCCELFKGELFQRGSVNTLLEFEEKQVVNFDYFGELSLKGLYAVCKGLWGLGASQRLRGCDSSRPASGQRAPGC